MARIQDKILSSITLSLKALFCLKFRAGMTEEDPLSLVTKERKDQDSFVRHATEISYFLAILCA